MVALMDLHIPHGGQPSQVSQSTLPHSFIQPVHEVEVRYAARQDLRPYDSFVPTHPCFSCLYLTVLVRTLMNYCFVMLPYLKH